MSTFMELLEFLNESKSSNIKKISKLVLRASKDNDVLRLAAELSEQKMQVDIHELESLVNPEKFDFPEPDIGRIGIEL